jgi:hypothetical protein
MTRTTEQFAISTYPSSGEFLEETKRLEELFGSTPIPSKELLDQFALYASPASLRRFLHFDRLYRKILDIPGVILLFGVRWGRDLATLQLLQQIYEPMNYTRRFIGFDTFAGFPSVAPQDGADRVIRPGAYAVSEAYEEHLSAILATKQRLGTFAHISRFELHKGDAVERLRAYLGEHPETIVSLAYFDLDLYEPTKACAELLMPYFTPGTIVGFDEFMHPIAPGETVAAREAFGERAAFRRIPNVGPGHGAYMVFGGDSRKKA